MATSAVAIALMTATPALADSNKGSGNDDRGISVNFGGIVRDLAKNFDREGTSTNFGKVVRDLAHERNDDKDRKHATTTVSISGVVTGINGTTITLSGRNGAVFTVNGANATVTGDEHTALTLGSIKLGDPLKRDPQCVAQDVARGYYTREQARDWFGVVLRDDGSVDAGATHAHRGNP